MQLSVLAFLGGVLLWSVIVDNPVVTCLMMVIITVYAWSAAANANLGAKGLNKLKPYYCEKCRKGFWTASGLKNHNISIHPQETKRRQAIARKRLKEREKGITQSTRWYDCPRCHGEKGNYECPFCEGMGRTLTPFKDNLP